MNENIFKTMKAVGISNLVLGIVAIASGVAIGVISIIHGTILLKNKSKVMF